MTKMEQAPGRNRMLTTAAGAIGKLGSCATATDPELAGAPCRDSISRFSRFKSVRISAACW